MELQFHIRAIVLTLVLSACTTSTAPVASGTASAAPSPRAASPAASATAAPAGLAEKPLAIVGPGRRWYTVPDGAFAERATVVVTFPAGDASAGTPRARIDASGAAVALRPEPVVPASGAQAPPSWVAEIPLDGIPPGAHTIEVLVRLRDGSDAVVGGRPIVVSQPEYVVWTLDFEGDAASNETMDNTWDIARSLAVPMTILWNPRAWTTTQVTPERAQVMQTWMESVARAGMAEIGLHLHMWTDFVQAAGVPPKLTPRWAGRSDGYDVPITAYSEDAQAKLIAYGLKLMADHGLGGVTSFRAGGDFADAATLRALVANGITADCTAVPAGTFGSLRWPWTLPADAQPYRPSREDANRPGDLPLLEAPTNAGNTYAYTTASIASIVRADIAMLARPGEAATARKALTLVSHPGTIDATERAAIEALFHAFDALRYDRDKGPLRFVTLRQLEKAWR